MIAATNGWDALIVISTLALFAFVMWAAMKL